MHYDAESLAVTCCVLILFLFLFCFSGFSVCYYFFQYSICFFPPVTSFVTICGTIKHFFFGHVHSIDELIATEWTVVALAGANAQTKYRNQY